MNKRIQVVLAVLNPHLRLELRKRLEHAPELLVSGESDCGEMALAQCERFRPNVLVLDCQLADLPGIQVARQIEPRRLPTQLLAIGAAETDREVLAMLQAGVRGYLLRHETSERIISGVRAVAEGAVWLSPAVAMVLGAWLRQVALSPPELNARELDVLRQIMLGKSNKEIAKVLCMKERTVEYRVSCISKKLRLASRVEMALWAKEREMYC